MPGCSQATRRHGRFHVSAIVCVKLMISILRAHTFHSSLVPFSFVQTRFATSKWLVNPVKRIQTQSGVLLQRLLLRKCRKSKRKATRRCKKFEPFCCRPFCVLQYPSHVLIDEPTSNESWAFLPIVNTCS